jgi:hypothetical protein
VVEDRAQGGGVGGRAAQRVGGGDDRVAVGAQVSDDAVPAGAVGERAVLQDDGRLGVSACVGGLGGLGRAVGGAAEGERTERETRRDRRDHTRYQPLASTLDAHHDKPLSGISSVYGRAGPTGFRHRPGR